jgi:hypothetical protein
MFWMIAPRFMGFFGLELDDGNPFAILCRKGLERNKAGHGLRQFPHSCRRCQILVLML